MNHFLLNPIPTGREFGSSDWLIGLESDDATRWVDSVFQFEATSLAGGPGPYKLVITGVYGLSGLGDLDAHPDFVGEGGPVTLTGVANLPPACLTSQI